MSARVQVRLCHSTHLQPGLGSPGETQLVGQYSCCDRGPVVASPAHQHHTQPGYVPLGAERHLGGAGGHLFRHVEQNDCTYDTSRCMCTHRNVRNDLLPWCCSPLCAPMLSGRNTEPLCACLCTWHLGCWYECLKTWLQSLQRATKRIYVQLLSVCVRACVCVWKKCHFLALNFFIAHFSMQGTKGTNRHR